MQLRKMNEMFYCYSAVLDNDVTIKFNINTFNYMHTTPLLTLLSELAAGGDITMLTGCVSYYWPFISSHLLSLLCFITETESPNSYKQLIPPRITLNTSSNGRSIDIINLGDDGFYDEYPGLKLFRDVDINDLAVLENWYKFRVHQIDNLSGQTDNAELLIDYGVECGIPGLLVLQHDLWYLSIITNLLEVNSDFASLDKVSNLSTEERINIVLTEANKSNIVGLFEQFILPIAEFADDYLSLDKSILIENCLLSLSKRCLPLVKLIFQRCYSPGCNLIPYEHLIHLAHKCLLSCELPQHVAAAYEMLQLISDKQQADTYNTTSDQSKILEIKSFIHAATILERYSIKLSISEIVAYNNAPESESHMLIRRLLRYLLLSEEFPSTNTWTQLWEDISTLRENVLPNLTLSACLTLFCESLLTSNFQDGINLASSFMRLKPESADTSVSTRHSLLTWEESHEVVLRAAQFYFNAASSFVSEEMYLARTCLNLLQPPPPAVQKEYNLIAALGILDDFHYDILPTKLRIWEDKTQLVINILDSGPRMHRYYSKIEKLMQLLEVSSIADADGIIPQYEVLVHTADIALKDDDWCVCEQLCYKIVQLRYQSGWKVCYKLASVRSFTNLVSREVLIAFALSICPNSQIESVLEASYTLSCQILDKATSKNISQQVIDNVTKLMGKALNKLAYFTGQVKEQPCSVDQNSIDQIQHRAMCINYHPYYRVRSSSYLYQLYGSQLQRSYVEFYSFITAIYELSLTDIQTNINSILDQYNDAVNKTFSIAIQYDTPLSLSYLLSMPDYASAYNCNDSITPHRFNIELFVYYITLSIYYSQCEDINIGSLATSPVDCFKQLERHINVTHIDNCSSLLKYFISNIQTVQVYWESDYLQDIPLDVDIEFYRTDKNYQKAIIRKLAQHLDTFGFALEVCTKHGMSEVEMRLELLLNILAKTSCSKNNTYVLLEHNNILHSLSNHAYTFYKCLVTRIYHLIPGTYYSNLIIYTDLLIKCEQELNATIIPYKGCRLTCQDLIKLLTLFQTNLPNIDFIAYANSSDPLTVLEPFLSVDIINALSSCSFVNPSYNYNDVITIEHLYLAYSCKIIYQIDVSSANEEFGMPHCGIKRDIIQAMDELTEHYVFKLFDRVLFTHRALSYSLNQRQYLFHYMCITINQLQSNDIKRKIQPMVIHLSKHIDACFSSIFDSISSTNTTPITTTKPQVYNADEFYLSKCEPTVINNILTRMLNDFYSPIIINALLTQANNVKAQIFNINDAFKNAISAAANDLQSQYTSIKNSGATLCNTLDNLSSYVHLDKLLLLLGDDPKHLPNEFIDINLLIELLKHILRSSDYDSNVKSGISVIFRSILSNSSSSDISIITQLRIEAYVKQYWTGDYDIVNIRDTSNHCSLISSLISISTTDTQYDTLCKIITILPIGEETAYKLYVAVFEAWTTSNVSDLELILFNRLVVNFTVGHDNQFISNLKANALFHSMLYSLMTPYSQYYKYAIQQLTAIPDLQDIPKELLYVYYELAILRNMTPNLVKIPIWTLFIDYLHTHSALPLTHIGIALNKRLHLISDEDSAATVVAKQLLDSGYK